MALEHFHPAVAGWFGDTFAAPTAVQARAWSAIRRGEHTLIAAPTGSGKTLAAFLAAIDALVAEGLERGLRDETHVVYVSPLKALSNDIERNLEAPLNAIRDRLFESGLPDVAIRAWVRTGDTPAGERARMVRQPPHILVTTPESLYILLTSQSGRAMLSTVRSVIVDEIHAVASNKRGAHLALSLERLEALTGPGLTRIGLSATQRPVQEIARFLTGDRSGTATTPGCTIIDEGHVRERDLALELPSSPLEAVMAGEVWEETYRRLAELIASHRTTLVFVNTRRMTERVARRLSELVGAEHVTAHHGSLSREHRHAAEQALKSGALKALVATASLELGIDIGDVDLVCQIGSPGSIATFLQRVGRSGHRIGAVPRGRLFPLSRDELVECAALLDGVRRGELETLVVPPGPLDVLAQQLVAECACRDCTEQELFDLARRAWPYRELDAQRLEAVLAMLASGYSTRRGRRGSYLHHDRIQRRVHARKGARLTALTCGGTIPDQADYDVVLEPDGHFVGKVNEDFALESLPGDIFQLGNHSYRYLRIEAGRVRVADARGLPPSIPFWFGEAPGRSDVLSQAVGRLREAVATAGPGAAHDLLAQDYGLPAAGVDQVADYLLAAAAMLGALPTTRRIVLERFFDEAGDMHLVVHAPFGSRVNRAWGLALRKRFCRKFNFELQAAATEDALILSLGPTHSFALADVARYLSSASVREVLIQALLATPLFTTRWRWNAATALAIRRFIAGKKTPPHLLRMQAEDLVALVFPDQLACAENIAGDRELPDHPLVEQTVADCLTEAMDLPGLVRVLEAIERGEIEVVARDLPEPSPLAREILAARPYAFLDDAPLEERRTRAVAARRFLDPRTAADLGRLDPEAIARVRREAWPDAADADELYDALMLAGAINEGETHAQAAWPALFGQLLGQGRATRLHATDGVVLWVAAERLPQWQAVLPDAAADPRLSLPASIAGEVPDVEVAAREIVRGRLEASGPVSAQELARALGLPAARVDIALLALEGEGFVLRGNFTGAQEEWCERRLLARIHGYTLTRLRREIEPVEPAGYARFLCDWQRLTPASQGEGVEALAAIVRQLEGFEAPAAAWEADILPARMPAYDPAWLDQLCMQGRVTWARLPVRRDADDEAPPAAGPVRSSPVALFERRGFAAWSGKEAGADAPARLGAPARAIHAFLESSGASFFGDIAAATGLLRAQLEDGLAELVAAGLVTADSFAGLRALVQPANRRRGRRPVRPAPALEAAGRWSLLPRAPFGGDEHARVEAIARTLLERYGVVVRRVLEREARRLPPWRDLVLVYRRLEARGEIRGGRFVAGFSGEQFALPEAVERLRAARRAPATGALVALGAADPLNLVGLLWPGTRVPAIAANRVVLRDGVPVAVQVGGEFQMLGPADAAVAWEVRNALLRRNPRAAPAPGHA